MTQPVDPLAPAIGACLACNQIFLIPPGGANCLLCGRPPAYTMPFTPAPSGTPSPYIYQPATTEEPAAEFIPITMSSLDLLLEVISAYLSGAVILADVIRGCFRDTGTDDATAASAVSHLTAVRELIASLTQPSELEPSAPAEPTSPPAEPALVAPGADAPLPQEDADRTNPDSP